MCAETCVYSRRVTPILLAIFAVGCGGMGAKSSWPDASTVILGPDVGTVTDAYTLVEALSDSGVSTVSPDVHDNRDSKIFAPDVSPQSGPEVGDLASQRDESHLDVVDVAVEREPDARSRDTSDLRSGQDSSSIAPVPYESIPQCRVNGTGAIFVVWNGGSCDPYPIPPGTTGVSGQVSAIYPILPSDAGVAYQLTCMGSCYHVSSDGSGAEYTISSVCRTEAYSSDGSLWGYVVCLPKIPIGSMNVRDDCGACVPAPIPTFTSG
jgi:hypothetical protein